MFGSVGLIIYTATLSTLITTALLLLIRKFEKNPVIVIILTGISILAMAPMVQTPRPWLFTILFFIIEFDILLTARRTGNYRYCLALPFIFALWANLHIQFIYGLFVMGVFFMEPLIENGLKSPFSLTRIKYSFNYRHWLIFIACFLATLVTPYHVHLYETILGTINQTGVYQYVSELQAMPFRDISSWCVLGLTLWACYVMGLNKPRIFTLLIFLAGIYLSFRAFRDCWFVVLCAIVIITESCSAFSEESRFKITKLHIFTILMTISVVLFYNVDTLSEEALNKTIAKKFPVRAVQIVKERGYEGPLYNDFDWGGYLIQNLPQLPVSMDGRGNIHGDKRIERSVKTWSGAADWVNDPELAGAKLIIANVSLPLASLLHFDKRFELVYEDSVAALFVAVPIKLK